MEIRGVGNILGEDQHGQIADIGYELYTQYLAQAILEMKGEPPEAFAETEMSWSIGSTYFPKNYITSHTDRIEFYRRISFSKTSSRIETIQSELIDRFGKMPAPTLQLIEYFRAKTRLREMGICSFKKKDSGSSVVIETFGWDIDFKLKWVLAHPKELAFYGETHIIVKIATVWNALTDTKVEQDAYTQYSYYNDENKPDPLEVLLSVLDFMERSIEKSKSSPDGQIPLG
jgi:transcription-repair coupling factor (superfamily II helicase)